MNTVDHEKTNNNVTNQNEQNRQRDQLSVRTHWCGSAVALVSFASSNLALLLFPTSLSIPVVLIQSIC